MPLRSHTAQSLTEYSLVIGLVALACISGVAILGSQIQQELGNAMGANVPAGSSVAQIPKALAAPFTQQQGFFLTPQEIQSILDQSPSQTLDLGNGKSVTIPKPNFPELQETLGPNGSTEVALALIQRMQEALKAQGIDPETVIPELSFFSKTGHQVSDQQKEGESLLTAFMYPGEQKVGDVVASMTSYNQKMGRQLGFFADREAKQLAFQKDANGAFFVSGTVEMNGQTNPNPKRIEDFPVIDRLFYTGEMTKQRLQTEPNLKALLPEFTTILDTINQNNNTLVYENRVRSTPYTGEIKEATWLSTKIESNKACLLSKDKTCLR
jgi:hypothetical protein